MNEHAGPAPISSTDLDKLGSPNGDVGISSFATRDATIAALNPNADVPDSDDDDETSTTTGLNPDPDYEKSAGAAELMTPDNAPGPDDNDELSSEDTDDDR